MTDEGKPPTAFDLRISWATIGKVFAAGALAFLAVRLLPLFMMLFLAGLLAVTFHPVIAWTRRRGWPHWIGVSAVAAALFGIVLVVISLIIPPLLDQGAEIIRRLPELREALLAQIPPDNAVRGLVERVLA